MDLISLYNIHFALIAAVFGALAGKRIGWAIRAWPGHESFHCDYLECPKCEGGKKRGCYNAGTAQDKFYIVFSALVAGFSVSAWGISIFSLVSWIFAISCLIVTVVDLRYLIIPDTLSIKGTYAGVVYAGICWIWIYAGYELPSYYVTVTDSLIGLFVGGGFLWLLGWFSLILLKKEGMGGGDVKLLAAFGAWSGWQVVLGTIVVASFLGSIGGISSIIYHKIKYRKKYKPLSHMIPFGPYLCVAFLFIFYFGLEPLYYVLDAYQNWLLSH